MKHRLFQIIMTSILLLGGAEMHAQVYQAPPVTISKDKVRSQDGTICYSHFVPERQTLYSICKAYGVSAEEIYAVNPGLKENGIKKNSIILIPVKAQLPAPTEAAEPAEATEAAEPAETTKPKEAAKATEPSEPAEATEPAETTATSEIQQPADETATGDEEQVLIHRVKWYENIDDIALKYNIPADYILKYNHLEGKKIKARMKLKIPKNYVPSSEELIEGNIPQTGEAEAAPSENVEDSTETEEMGKDWFNSRKHVEIMLNLPFDSEGNGNRSAYDFYGGFLLGIRQMENVVTDIDLNVMDCAKNLPVTRENIADNQIVFGPISSGQLEKIASLKSEKTMVISPLDPRAEKTISTYHNFIQVPPCESAQYMDLARWVGQDYQMGDNILTIYEKGHKDEHADLFNQIITESGLGSKFFSYTILEGRALGNKLADEMVANSTNRILINSENEAFVNDVLRNLNILLHKKIDIVIYCPSKIKSFETIDVENLHNLNAHMSGSYYTDFENPEAKDFVMKYRALYHCEPTQFAFQGYDLATYFIGLYTRYGAKWPKHLEEAKESRLQISFDFRKTEYGSYLNHGTRRFVYEPDFQVRYINR